MMDKIIRQIKKENDPEVLKAYLEHMVNRIDALQTIIADLQEKKALEAQLRLNFEEELKVLRRKFWRKSSERRPKPKDRERDQENMDLTLQTQTPFPAPREKNLELEKREVFFDLSPEELKTESELRGLANPKAEQWSEIEGLFDKKKRIHVIERQYVEEIIHLKKYKLKPEFNTSEKEVIVTAQRMPA